jgi:hypothetical protein
MRSARKILVLVFLLVPGVSSACSCAMPGIYQDSINGCKNLFFGKIISAKVNEEWIEDRLRTTSMDFEYRVDYVIRGKHHVGEVVKETTYPYGSACSRVPHINVNDYFLSNGALGNACGLLVSPLTRMRRAELEIIGMTEGGVDALQWLESIQPDMRINRKNQD